jgi:hypothetical protein
VARSRLKAGNLQRLIQRSAPLTPESAEPPNDRSIRLPKGALRKLWADRLVPPPTCPEGWQIGPPTYVGVGVQKAGTTWWHHAITSHPDVLSPVRKELHYFQHQGFESFEESHVKEYHQYFPRAGASVTGEWTPRYMLDPVTPMRLRRAAPDARILVLLRDPMKRLESNLRQVLGKFSSLHPSVILEAIQRGRYPEQLSSLEKAFPRNQILVLQYERCVQSPESELRRTYEFIGVDQSFVPSDLREPQKKGRGEVPQLPQDLARVARELYESDLPRLRADWPEVDVDLWSSVSRAQ